MAYFPRFAALFFMVLASLTLVRPKTGWGRLGLFVPKLFTATYIGWIGLFGLVSGLTGWIFLHDVWAGGFGLGAAAVSASHIYRILRQGQKTAKDILQANGSQGNEAQNGILPKLWMVRWEEFAEAHWEKDVPVVENPETGKPVLADLWSPPDPKNRSGLGLIYLHGSGWHYADKDFGTRQFFRHLTGQGHVIADLAYTLAPQADLLSMMGDIKRTIGWMKENKDELGIRADRIVMMGGSAGGHLALLAGFTPNHPQLDPPDLESDTSVCGVVSYYGPPDLRAQFERFAELPGLTGRTKTERSIMRYLEGRFGFATVPVHKLLPEFMGGTPDDIPELYDLGSPCKHISADCPPTLLLQGLHDFSGAAPEVHKLYDNLKNIGGKVYLFELPGCDHGFDLYKPKWSPAAQAGTYVTDRFLASLV